VPWSVLFPRFSVTIICLCKKQPNGILWAYLSAI
jgi:hypothetical protein